MKEVGCVRRFLPSCFSPSTTTTTTTTTTNRITKFSADNKTTAITDVTTTTTTTKQQHLTTTTRTNSTTNKRKPTTLSSHQRYLDPSDQTRDYYYDYEDAADHDEELSSSSMDEKVVPEYYPSYNDNNNNKDSNPNKYSLQPPRQLPPPPPAPPVVPLKSVVTGTFYGHRKGHICFCIQKDRLNYAKPPLLLELSIPTDDLVKEMQRELVRIVLECDSSSNKSSCRLLSIPIWTMYVNGRKVGFAARRRPTDKDRLILKTMQSTTVGAGVIPKELATMESSHYPHHQGGGGADDGGGSGAGDGDELIFMRANYKRVVGSFDTESFHLTNPDGCLSSQELSVFLMRSR